MIAEVPRWIAVDDTDSEIHYTGASWFQDVGARDSIGNYGPAYQSTLHGTNEDASLSYSSTVRIFSGTGVKVMGSNNPNGGYWQCYVDGISIGTAEPYKYAQNNWLFCDKSDLPDGPHVIAVNATITKGQTFWFDNILYKPSSTDALDQKVVVFGNADPGIQYGSGWRPFSDVANATRTTGSTLSFSFNGISLSLYGFLPVEYPRLDAPCSYSVDGQPPVNFLIKGLPAARTTSLYNQKFLETSQYPAGEHKIVITYLGSSQTTPFVLGTLIVQNGSSTSPLSNTVDSSFNSPPSSNHSNIIAPVMGGILGGLVLLLIAPFVFVKMRRRRKERSLDLDIEPFAQSSNAHEYSQSSGRNLRLETRHGISLFGKFAMTQAPVFIPRPWISRKARLDAASTSSGPSGPNLSQRSTHEPQSSMASSSRLIQHEDSGVRLPQEADTAGIVEIPPVYTIG